MSEEFDFGLMSEPMKTASEQADEKLRGMLNRLSRWRSVVVLAAMMLVTLVLPLVTAGLANPLDGDFWLNAVYGLVIATLSYYIFAPFGARSERLESTTYAVVIARWVALSRAVREGGLIEAFYRFCTKRREEERVERKALFIEAAGIPEAIWRERYEGLSKAELKKLKKAGELTRKQCDYLIAANGEIEVLPINPSMILSGLKVDNINDAGRGKRWKILGLIRPLTLILTMIVRGALQIAGNENVEFLDYLTQTATNLFIIVTWSFTGFRYGVSCVREEEQAVCGRSEFLCMFLEREGKAVSEIIEKQAS